MEQNTAGAVYIQDRPIGDVRLKPRPVTVGTIRLPDGATEFSAESIARLKRQFEALYVGAANAAEPEILPEGEVWMKGGMKCRCYVRGWTPLGLFNTVIGCVFNRVLVKTVDTDTGEDRVMVLGQGN